MGLDGGTVVNSSAFLKASAAQKNTNANDDGGVQSENELATLEHKRRWTCCALSGKKFTTTDGSSSAICCDQKGNLFLKEFILEFLIAKKKGTLPTTAAVLTNFMSGKFDHIKTMKNDVCVLKLRVPSANSSEQEEEKRIQSMFNCSFFNDVPPPLTPRAAPFYVRWKCGHLFSAAALNDLLKQQKEDERLLSNNNNNSVAAASGASSPNNTMVLLKTCPISKCEKANEESVMIQLVQLESQAKTRRERE